MKFCTFKLGLTDKCQYELDVTKSLEVLLHGDIHTQLSEAIDKTKQGVSNPVICFSCKQKITLEPIFVFRYVYIFNFDIIISL